MKYARQQLFIAGKRHSTPETFLSVDPSCDRPLAEICKADKPTVHAAVEAGKRAFPSWSTTPPISRSRILLRAVALLRQRNDDLARIETHDTGKPFSETSTVDIATGADVLEYYANLIASGGLNGETTYLRPDAWVYTTKAPLGVCAGIGAWNYPIQIALWKSAPCLAAGNCMVYKPSEFTPLHALQLAELYAEAGLPPGVFNVVQGAGDVGALLTSHPGIAKVRQIPLPHPPRRRPRDRVDGAMMANFFSTGQVCTNGTRVFVPDTLLPAFEARLLAKMPHIRAGDLMDPATNFGPLVSRVHRDKVLAYIRHGVETDGARLLAGGPEAPPSTPGVNPAGFWVRPTVFTNCTDGMRIVREEIFGPVMCLLPYSITRSTSYLDTLIARANDTTMGLAAGVFTKDLDLAHKVVARLEAGITWVNTWGESPAEMAVGGWKMSGLGVENGRRGLEGWVRNKSTLVEMGGVVGTVFAKL
ncbi:hypothetical protein LTR57_005017 [Friedmanniomyces endolithicus]|nr:hypothetical protein LTR57_005017 [Friedmanniomyces endolithicus]